TNAAWLLFLLGAVTGMARLMDVGIILFLGYVVFSLITLPVEFNASHRAVAVLQGQGLVAPQEAAGVRSVLNAAALTYVAAAARSGTRLTICLRASGPFCGRPRINCSS